MYIAQFHQGNERSRFASPDVRAVLNHIGLTREVVPHYTYYVDTLQDGHQVSWGWWDIFPTKAASDLEQGDVVDVNDILGHYGEHLPEYEGEYGVVDYVQHVEENVLLIGLVSGPEISVEPDLTVLIAGKA